MSRFQLYSLRQGCQIGVPLCRGVEWWVLCQPQKKYYVFLIWHRCNWHDAGEHHPYGSKLNNWTKVHNRCRITVFENTIDTNMRKILLWESCDQMPKKKKKKEWGWVKMYQYHEENCDTFFLISDVTSA